MVTPDTNVLVRLLTEDDEAQYQQAYELFQNERIWILSTVLLETEWVLRYAYEFQPEQIVTAVRLLAGLPNVELDQPLTIAEALNWHEQGLDFADALHVAKAKDSDRFVTFDKKLVAKAENLTSLPVDLL
ncbi:MAG: type II toxin-antitoxin system VapC family toxin [Anaerolineae bacterium]